MLTLLSNFLGWCCDVGSPLCFGCRFVVLLVIVTDCYRVCCYLSWFSLIVIVVLVIGLIFRFALLVCVMIIALVCFDIVNVGWCYGLIKLV